MHTDARSASLQVVTTIGMHCPYILTCAPACGSTVIVVPSLASLTEAALRINTHHADMCSGTLINI